MKLHTDAPLRRLRELFLILILIGATVFVLLDLLPRLGRADGVVSSAEAASRLSSLPKSPRSSAILSKEIQFSLIAKSTQHSRKTLRDVSFLTCAYLLALYAWLLEFLSRGSWRGTPSTWLP